MCGQHCYTFSGIYCSPSTWLSKPLRTSSRTCCFIKIEANSRLLKTKDTNVSRPEHFRTTELGLTHDLILKLSIIALGITLRQTVWTLYYVTSSLAILEVINCCFHFGVVATVYSQQDIFHLHFSAFDFLRGAGILHNVLLRHWLAAVLCICCVLCHFSGMCMQTDSAALWSCQC